MYAACFRVLAVLGAVALAAGGCRQARQPAAPGAMPGRWGVAANPRIRPTTYFAHGHLLERQGSYERAVRQYRRALELLPDFVTCRNRLGITLNKLGRHAEASAEFRRAIELEPAAAYLHNNLGFSLYLEGRYAEAEAEVRRALEINDAFPRAHMNRALALAKLGRFEEAFGELCRVGSEADAYYNLAMLETEARRYASAARSLDMALRLNPELEAARQQLRELSLLAAREEAAVVADVAVPGADRAARPVPTATLPAAAPQAAAAQAPQPTVIRPLPAAGAAAPALVDFFPDAVPGDWFDEFCPGALPAEGPAAAAAQAGPEGVAPGRREEAADRAPPAVDGATRDAPPAVPPGQGATINDLIAAIVNRAEALVSELWCELEDRAQGSGQPPAGAAGRRAN